MSPAERRFRRASCESKVRHETEQKAREVILLMKLRNTAHKPVKKLVAYRCSYCSGFHIGHAR